MSLYAGGNRERLIELDATLIAVAPTRNQAPHITLSPRTAEGLPTQGILLSLIAPVSDPAVGTGATGVVADGGGGGAATPGCFLSGAPVSSLVADYVSITNGGFDISVGGVNVALYALDLSSATSMDDIALLIQIRIAQMDAGDPTVVSVSWSGVRFLVSTCGLSGAVVLPAVAPTGGEESMFGSPADVSAILGLTEGAGAVSSDGSGGGGSGGSGSAGVGGDFGVTIYRCIPTLGTWAELAPFTAAAHYGEQYVLSDISGGWGLYFLITGVTRPGRILLGIAEMD